jgi:hypothetical protein
VRAVRGCVRILKIPRIRFSLTGNQQPHSSFTSSHASLPSGPVRNSVSTGRAQGDSTLPSRLPEHLLSSPGVHACGTGRALGSTVTPVPRASCPPRPINEGRTCGHPPSPAACAGRCRDTWEGERTGSCEAVMFSVLVLRVERIEGQRPGRSSGPGQRPGEEGRRVPFVGPTGQRCAESQKRPGLYCIHLNPPRPYARSNRRLDLNASGHAAGTYSTRNDQPGELPAQSHGGMQVCQPLICEARDRWVLQEGHRQQGS